MFPTASNSLGKVYLVGAGPGDPGSITWRGVECLRRADVVLYDYLVNPRILIHARPGADMLCLGRHGGPAGPGVCPDRIMPQAEVNRRLIELARSGRSVVRLKGGDPAVFGRLAEEAEALTAAGVPLEIVPGITAALAAGSYAGIMLTHRDEASAVALVTGRETDDKQSSGLDFAALAAFPGTLVFYMGLTTAHQWTSELISNGKPPDTPAAIVRRVSWPDQTVTHTTLGRVAEDIAAAKMRPPVVVIVGSVVAATACDWFRSRPLFGRRVLVTRPLDQAETLCGRLSELGAECLLQPAIQISPPSDWGPVDSALSRLDEFDWLAFSSANGVRFLLERLLEQGGDLRRLAGLRIAAMGPGTGDELTRYHLKADLQPEQYRAEALAEMLRSEARGRRFLLARASRGRAVLPEELVAAGATVEQIVIYESRDVPQPDAPIAAALAAGRIDWITVTSSAIARSLVRMFGEQLRNSCLASISPITSATLRSLGYEPAAEATEFTMDGVVAAILAAIGN
ncbi:MAG TPA: uroporphyrinogen-III C-methyltransferase [Pirellulales bacterium]|nr:uroporphyrinogen-III C-methyltransferase [Pirellulales bacterium]